MDEIYTLSTAANAFLAVIQAQDSDAYKKLRKHWSDKVIRNADMLSGRLEQVAENLGNYINAMTIYISPVDEGQDMRVDRNNIWFNYTQIGMSTIQMQERNWFVMREQQMIQRRTCLAM